MRHKTMRTIFAVILVMVLPALAAAYTLVLRDGRQLEVGGKVTVTQTTVTYERAPGFNVTLQLSIIDIPATERINNLPPGSFLKFTQKDRAPHNAAAAHTRVTITNAQLEASRRTRLESERAYEQRRRELGLPTLEETRRREQMEADEVRETLREQRILKQNDEAYWRDRAGELRAELVQVDAQIAYLNARLAELPSASVFTGVVIGGGGPFLPYGSARGSFGQGWRGPAIARRPGVYVAPNRGASVSGQLRFGSGHTSGRVVLNPAFGRGRFGHGRGGFGSLGLPYGTTYPSLLTQPFGFESSYERAAVTEQLHELFKVRAGLQARWRLLEDEARRAGAPPGWLRP